MTRPSTYPAPDPSRPGADTPRSGADPLRPNSLWPRDLLAGDQRIPVTVLNVQAEQLGALAGDALTVTVRSTADAASGLCSHRLIVAISGIDNYFYELVRLSHPIHAVFPVGVRCETTGLVLAFNSEAAPTSAAKLEEFLRGLFGTPAVRSAVRSLFAQGQAYKGDKKRQQRRASDDASSAA